MPFGQILQNCGNIHFVIELIAAIQRSLAISRMSEMAFLSMFKSPYCGTFCIRMKNWLSGPELIFRYFRSIRAKMVVPGVAARSSAPAKTGVTHLLNPVVNARLVSGFV